MTAEFINSQVGILLQLGSPGLFSTQLGLTLRGYIRKCKRCNIEFVTENSDEYDVTRTLRIVPTAITPSRELQTAKTMEVMV